MKIAYFSPFNPIKSGISDFSEELVMKLKEYIDVDIFVDGYKPSNKDIIDNFKVYNFSEIYDEKIRSQYDHLVYQVGNNAEAHSKIVDVFNDFPGICELHDISLHHFLAERTISKNNAEDYINIMKYCHGKKGEERAKLFLNGTVAPPWEEESLKYTVNKHIIDKATAVIVHSDMAKQMVKGINNSIAIKNISHHTADIVDDADLFKSTCREKLGIDNKILIFASFGFASKNKRIVQILEALSLYKEKTRSKFKYYIVGKVQGIDIGNLTKKLNIEDNVIVTGYTTLDEFRYYMGACDIAINLRYPTQGETSGSLHRLFGMGKNIIVTNIGSFEEYPDDIIFKIRYDENEVEDIFNTIYKITKNKSEMKEREKRAIKFAKEFCDLNKNAQLYAEFYNQIKDGSYKEDIIDSIVDKLFELDLIDDSYVEHLIKEGILF